MGKTEYDQTQACNRCGHHVLSSLHRITCLESEGEDDGVIESVSEYAEKSKSNHKSTERG